MLSVWSMMSLAKDIVNEMRLLCGVADFFLKCVPLTERVNGTR